MDTQCNTQPIEEGAAESSVAMYQELNEPIVHDNPDCEDPPCSVDFLSPYPKPLSFFD